MTFGYRIKLYVFGFLLGLVILAIILKGKKCSGVAEIKLAELTDQTTWYSEKALCQLKCLNISTDSLDKLLLDKFRVNYDRSEVHAVPCGKYFVEPNKKNEYPFTLTILDCDTVSKIEKLDLKSDCNCDSLSATVFK